MQQVLEGDVSRRDPSRGSTAEERDAAAAWLAEAARDEHQAARVQRHAGRPRADRGAVRRPTAPARTATAP